MNQFEMPEVFENLPLEMPAVLKASISTYSIYFRKQRMALHFLEDRNKCVSSPLRKVMTTSVFKSGEPRRLGPKIRKYCNSAGAGVLALLGLFEDHGLACLQLNSLSHLCSWRWVAWFAKWLVRAGYRSLGPHWLHFALGCLSRSVPKCLLFFRTMTPQFIYSLTLTT